VTDVEYHTRTVAVDHCGSWLWQYKAQGVQQQLNLLCTAKGICSFKKDPVHMWNVSSHMHRILLGLF